MRVLIIGLDTPVGQALERLFVLRARDYVGLNRSDCRWKSERRAKKALRRSSCDIALDLRLQSAADGGVKIHEVDLNRSKWLARAANSIKVPFIHISCDRVFQGDGDRPYLEADTPDGRSSLSKLLIGAENLIREACPRHVLLRLGPVFSPDGANVVTHILSELNRGEILQLDKDQRLCPVAVEDAAWVICALVDQLSCGVEIWGDFHYCSSDVTNGYELGEVLLAAASQYRELSDEAVQAKDDLPAKYLELNCEKIKSTFAIKQQSWRARVTGHVKQFYTNFEEDKRVENKGH